MYQQLSFFAQIKEISINLRSRDEIINIELVCKHEKVFILISYLLLFLRANLTDIHLSRPRITLGTAGSQSACENWLSTIKVRSKAPRGSAELINKTKCKHSYMERGTIVSSSLT